jgi:pilus assembly protein Flp/PilA
MEAMNLEGLTVERSERGATAVEYGLFVALIAGVIIATVVLLGPQIAGLYAAAAQGW